MLKVGLTGNIGSGKSTVSRIFEVIGIPVFHADKEAKGLYELETVKQRILDVFGKEVFSGNSVDFKKLANVIFGDKGKLQTINNIIHPLVFERFNCWLIDNNDSPYIIHESAIIFENNLQSRYDKIINVSADTDIRIERVINRDGVEKSMVINRIKNQMSDTLKSELSDYVIQNNQEDMLIPQVLTIDKELRLFDKNKNLH
jgi:dephospho-CoA kinase